MSLTMIKKIPAALLAMLAVGLGISTCDALVEAEYRTGAAPVEVSV